MGENEAMVIRKDMMLLNHKVKRMENTIDDLQSSLEEITQVVNILSKKLDILSTPDYIGKANQEYEKRKGND